MVAEECMDPPCMVAIIQDPRLGDLQCLVAEATTDLVVAIFNEASATAFFIL